MLPRITNNRELRDFKAQVRAEVVAEIAAKLDIERKLGYWAAGDKTGNYIRNQTYLRAIDTVKGAETQHNPYAEYVAPYAAAIAMIREAIDELFGPVANLESPEAVLLRGPEPHHDAEAIISALQRINETLNADCQRCSS